MKYVAYLVAALLLFWLVRACDWWQIQTTDQEEFRALVLTTFQWPKATLEHFECGFTETTPPPEAQSNVVLRLETSCDTLTVRRAMSSLRLTLVRDFELHGIATEGFETVDLSRIITEKHKPTEEPPYLPVVDSVKILGSYAIDQPFMKHSGDIKAIATRTEGDTWTITCTLEQRDE